MKQLPNSVGFTISSLYIFNQPIQTASILNSLQIVSNNDQALELYWQF